MRVLLRLLVYICCHQSYCDANELASWAKSLDNSAAALQVDCSVCAQNSECVDGHCKCKAGWIGDQPLQCFKSSNPRQKPELLMPLYDAPPDIDQYRKCSSFLWRRVAEQGAGTVAFVNIDKDVDTTNYLICLQMLKSSDVSVYIRVSMEYGFAMDLKSTLEGHHDIFSDVIVGYYVDHPPADLNDKRVLEIIQKIKTLNRTNKVAIATHESEWSVKLLAHPNYKLRADLLVVFDSTHSRWNQACGRFGSGPYCRKVVDFKQRFDTILKRIMSGRSNRRQFAAIIYDVQAYDLADVLVRANKNGVGLLHVTNMPSAEENQGGPSYWDFLLLNIRQDEKCGCVDLNECKTHRDECHEYAACTNTIGSHICECPPHLVGDGRSDGIGCHEDECAKCSQGTQCTDNGACICDSGTAGTGLECPQTNAVIPLSIPKNSHNDLCDDESWNYVSSFPYDSIDTTVIIDLDVNFPDSYFACLKLMRDNNVTILHEESLWNGLKVKDIVQVRLERIMETFGYFVDGVYFSNTPNNLFSRYGNVDYFADIMLAAKQLRLDFKVAVDVWDTEWPINILTGTMTDSFGRYIDPVDWVVVFRSNYGDWYQDCSIFHEGPFCPNQMLQVNMVNDLQNAIAQGRIQASQLVAWIFDADSDQYEKMFRKAHQSNVASLFVTSGAVNAPIELEHWDDYYNSLKGLWPECGCFDLNECDDETHQCTQNQFCVNNHGGYTCFDPSSMNKFGMRMGAGSCSMPCDANAQCLFGDCECAPGYRGMGLDCDASTQTNRMVIPIRKSPKIQDGICTDAYWINIAELDLASVILEVYSNHWLPCIQFLVDNNVHVYAKINGNNGKFKKMLTYLQNEVDAMHSAYQGLVNPYFTQPGKTFETDWMYDAIEYSRNKNLKIGIQATDASWSIDCVKKKKIDLVVIFKGRYRTFVDNCGDVGPGPFCGMGEEGEELSFQLREAVSAGKLSSDTFASIVYNANTRDIDTVVTLTDAFNTNGVFLTEKPYFNTQKPVMWNQILYRIGVSDVNKAIRESGEDCGCIDVDECANRHDNCDENAACINTNGAFDCECNSGFDGDGVVCLDINECTKGIHNCDVNALCNDLDTTFECTCETGFVGDGQSCEDIDECLENVCDELASCTNTIGSFSCECDVGFIGDGFNCIDVDECSDGNNDCDTNAECFNIPGAFNCSCNIGFVGSGTTCVDIDECTSKNDFCASEAICSNTVGSFSCSCPKGFNGDGETICQRDACNFCHDGAKCSDDRTTCFCPAGTSGPATKCSTSRMVIPIQKIPLVGLKAEVCMDRYWKDIAKLGYQSSVVLTFPTATWIPCMKVLRDAGSDVYVAINARKSQFTNMAKYFTKQITLLEATYGDAINGIYINNPGPQGFFPSFYTDVINHAKGQGLNVALETYRVPFDVNTVRMADLVVVFKDTVDRFKSACGVHGVGPFCQRSTITTHQLAEIDQDIQNGVIPKEKIASMVYGVSLSEASSVISTNHDSIVGSVFVSNYPISNTRKPTFWDLIIKSNFDLTGASECGCSDIDECNSEQDPCPINSSCENQINTGFSCHCNTGFEKSESGECIDLNECLRSSACDRNADCVNVVGGFQCACRDGYDGNGFVCNDINECEDNDTCDVNAACTNHNGTFSCVCNNGFTGDGLECEDANECNLDPCGNNTTCLNSIGSFSCSCNDGYTDVAGTCDNINECSVGHECHLMADCFDTDGSYECSCRRGFTGDGEGCSRSLCSLCDDAAECTGGSCVCPSGYRGDAFSCQAQKNAVIPVSTPPSISVRTGVCVDPFWLSAGSSRNHVIIADNYDINWLPCIKHVRRRLVDVYGTIYVGRSDLNDEGLEIIMEQMQSIVDTFKGNMNGVHLETDDRMLFTLDEWQTIFDFARTAQLSISIEGYRNVWDLRTANDVDMIVIFKDNLSQFARDCFAGNSIGPFCRQNQIKAETIKSVQRAIDAGYISAKKFVTVVYNVHESSMHETFDNAAKSISGSVFITSDEIHQPATSPLPPYWNSLASLLTSKNNEMRLIDPHCGCTEIDECVEFANVCPTNALCQNTIGSFECSCENGYIPKLNELSELTCIDENECINGIAKCDENAICDNISPGYTCTCALGFSGDGLQQGTGCTDVDECDRFLHDCHSHASCFNTKGSFFCACADGYAGDGITDGDGCFDINECSVDLEVCDADAACINKEPMYACDCHNGFTGDGINSCDDIDECSLGFDECHPMALCTNTIGSYNCECLDDWSGNGRVCSQNICSQCDSLATCNKDCNCPNGYTGDGYNCSKSNVVIPIFTMPDITDNECTDKYWLSIATKRGVSVILEVEIDDTWYPCLHQLISSGVEVYAKVSPISNSNDAKKFQLMELAISTIKEMHGSGITGVYLTESNIDGFTSTDYERVFTHASQHGLLIAIDGHGTKWNLDTVNMVDLIVTFKGDLSEFEAKCSTTLCQQDLDAMDEIVSAIETGYMSRTKFATLIFDVDTDAMEDIYNVILPHRVSRSIFITDRSFGVGDAPSYFDEMVENSRSLLENTVGERSINTCGCRDVDECELGTHICPVYSRCENIEGGYKCFCIEGFTDHVTWSRLTVANGEFNCVDINECVDIDDLCGSNTNCINTVGSHVCECIDGFIRDEDGTCRDVDECSVQLDNCDVSSVCTNTIGSFNCKCLEGYDGDGKTNGSGCIDIDECDEHVDDCHDVATCTNTPGEYFCTCPVGFAGDGLSSSTGCSDVNECESDLNNCHVMASCTNTDGAFECECIEDWTGNGFSCALDICSICDSSASCDGTACHCQSGYSGSGFYCPKNALVIPIKTKPQVSPHSKLCTDPYWASIATNPDNCVILENVKPSWQPCMEILAESNVEIFLTLDTSPIAVEIIKEKIDAAISEQGDLISGIMLTNPNTIDGFADESFVTLFDYIKGHDLKVAIEGHGNIYNIETINRVDFVVLFKGSIQEYNENCIPGRSAGPFCNQAQLTNAFVNELTGAIDANIIESAKFISMVFEVDKSIVDSVILAHYSSPFDGGVFVSDQDVSQITHRPSYFSYLSGEIRMTSDQIDAESNCGCNEIDECKLGIDECPANSECKNLDGGYLCSCRDGFEEMITNGVMTCRDVDECASQVGNCNESATCTNTVGSFICQCDGGYIGDGIECEDIDECSSNDGHCHDNSECVNLPGSYACVCHSGFAGDGRLVQGCQDRNECALRIANCGENSQCVNIDGGFICQCDEGFENHHGICVDIDECTVTTDNCHPMAECTNLDGGYDCECIGDWHGDGRFCSFDICSVCYMSATCDGEECNCPKGYSGSGYECPSASAMVLPINSKPEIDHETRECTDEYWSMISTTENSVVILERFEPSWKPCMKMLLDSGSDVYLSIKTFKDNAITKINFISKSYRSRFSGILFADSSNLSGVTHARKLGYKIGVEMTSKVDYEAAVGSDLVVLFKNNSDAFVNDCGYYGHGPFCHHDQSQAIEDLRFAVSRGDQTASKFVSMVFDVPLSDIGSISNVHYANTFNGGLYLSDSLRSDKPFRPTYFINLVDLINQNMIDTSPNCGCSEIDECAAGTASCPLNSNCLNTDGGYECHCLDGYSDIIGINGALQCTDIDECASGGHNCDFNSDCINNPGGFDCSCHVGFTGDGVLSGSGCSDQDECDLQIDDCVENASCSNNAGSYVCHCPTGFVGNGEMNDSGCSDVNECDHDPCHSNSICSNSHGSYQCNCLTGFAETADEECDDINECESGEHNCHLMSTCQNEEGSFSCTCNENWSGDGVTCSQHICQLCDDSASCVDDSCVCQIGMTGSGIECRNHLVPMPIRHQPEIQNGECIDPYIIKISQQSNVRVILSFQSADWYPCVRLLHESKTDVFATINAEAENVANFDRYMLRQVDKQLDMFPEGLTGIMITNPGLEGFRISQYDHVFHYIANHGLKVGIDAYGKQWTLDVAKKVDYVILFADNVNAYLNNCGEFGPGPFCNSQSKLINDIVTAVEIDDLSGNKFGTMVYGVSSDNFGNVADIQNANVIGGGLYVNNFMYPSPNEPIYFDHMMDVFNKQHTENCGCFDIDECALSTHNCMDHSQCSNIDRSYECICDVGYKQQVGSNKCTDIDECSNVEACPDLSTCENSIGSYTCDCQEGFVLNGLDELECQDVDECAQGLDDCYFDESCENVRGTFSCSNKQSLENDECALGAHICPAHSTCINSYLRINPTGYVCSCDEGFECASCYSLMPLEDFACSDIDECSIGTAECDLETATCLNTIGSYECECESFEESDGAGGCVIVDPCAEGAHQCPELSSCASVMVGAAQYQCTCDEGYHFQTGTEVTCGDIDECEMKTHDCLASQTCNNLQPGFECTAGACETLSCSHDCQDGQCICPDGMEVDISGINCQIMDSEVDILCESDVMKVLVKKSFFENLSQLQLNDPTCDMTKSNIIDLDGDYFIAQTNLDSCGTTVEVSDTNIIFTNSLYDNVGKARDESSGSWIRVDPIVTLRFSCLYHTVVDVDNTISVEPSFLEGTSNGRGNFQFNLQTYTDPGFVHEQSTGYKTGEIMYFDVTIDREVAGVEFTVTDCTVYNFDRSKQYNVITEKCLDPYINAKMVDDYTVTRRARFSYTVFEFVGATGAESITLTCRISICHPGDLFYSACAAGCPMNQRKRRSLDSQSYQTSITIN